MRIYLYSLLMIIILTLNLFSQWIYDTTLPRDQGGGNLGLGIMSIVDSSVTWILGAYTRNNPQIIYIAKRNINGWNELKNYDIDSQLTLTTISAKDSLKAWIGTSDARVYYTTNGGTHWLLQIDKSDSSGAFVRGISFSHKFPNIGYIFMGRQNFAGVYIFKTTNYGLNWNQTVLDIPGYTAMRESISVIDSNYAWFGLLCNCGNCYTSKLVMTSNGGYNWNVIDVYSMVDPDAIQFSENKSTGIYVSTDFIMGSSVIYKTTNYGLNWSPVYNYNSPFFEENIKWVNETSVIYLNNIGDRVKRSIDNSITWTNMYPVFNLPTLTAANIDAIKINNSTIYGLILIPETINNSPMVYKLIDSVSLFGIKKDNKNIPGSYSLLQNYPNPFNPSTSIKYSIVKNNNVSLKIYNIVGQYVTTLVNEPQKPGEYEVNFNGVNFASGVYFYKLESGSFVATKKMVLMK